VWREDGYGAHPFNLPALFYFQGFAYLIVVGCGLHTLTLIELFPHAMTQTHVTYTTEPTDAGCAL
jgi:hypothetical protein